MSSQSSRLAPSCSANLKKRLIGYLDLVFPEFERLFSDCHGPTGRAVLASAASARLMAGRKASALARTMQRVSHGRLGLERARVKPGPRSFPGHQPAA